MNHLNSDSRKMSNRHFNGKWVLMLALANKPRELFSPLQPKRHVTSSHYFINKSVKQVLSQKNLRMVLNTKWKFQKHLENVLNKINETIGLLRKLQNILPRRPLLTICKSFIRPHLDYVILYVINTTMILSIKNWSQYNIMLL